MRFVLDIPNRDPEQPMVLIGIYDDRQAALDDAQKYYGADENGMLQLVTEIPDEDNETSDSDMPGSAPA
jgi:hypothetical protein